MKILTPIKKPSEKEEEEEKKGPDSPPNGLRTEKLSFFPVQKVTFYGKIIVF